MGYGYGVWLIINDSDWISTLHVPHVTIGCFMSYHDARALYNDPGVLIFDESTSSLDEATERNFLQSINKIKKDKTVIFVTHRKSVLNDCDKIFCLDAGNIIFSGTPAEFKMLN